MSLRAQKGFPRPMPKFQPPEPEISAVYPRALLLFLVTMIHANPERHGPMEHWPNGTCREPVSFCYWFPPEGAIAFGGHLFMTYFYRAGVGAMDPSPPPPICCCKTASERTERSSDSAQKPLMKNEIMKRDRELRGKKEHNCRERNS